MDDLLDTIQVDVEQTIDEEYGLVYVASNDLLSLATSGQTFKELLANLKEAILLILHDDVRADFHLVKHPQVVITMKLPEDFIQTARNQSL